MLGPGGRVVRGGQQDPGTIPSMFELGNNLREARHRRRIDLVIAEQDTKIRSKYLAALETEDFDVLPGAVFVRGFLRTYSRYLGLDPQLFVDEYNARFGRFEELEEQGTHALGRPSLAQERDRRGRLTMRVIAIASLLAIAVFAWLGLREGTEPANPETTSSRRLQDPSPEPSTANPGALSEAAIEAGTTAPSGRGTPATDPGTARSTKTAGAAKSAAATRSDAAAQRATDAVR